MGCSYSAIMSVEKASANKTAPPQWLSWIEVDLDRWACWDHAQCSDCIEIQADRITVLRKTKRRTSDGIKFAKPLSSGKYKFEINWLPIYRGSSATIGLASVSTLTSQPTKSVSLVGSTKNSWGFDIVRKRIINNSQVVSKYPPIEGAIPSKIYMYVDMDQGNVSFGSDEQYWGIAFQIGGYDTTMYAMVGITEPYGMVQMVYHGKAVNPRQQQGAVGGVVTGGPIEHNLGFEGKNAGKEIMLDEIDCGPVWFRNLTRPNNPSDHEFCFIDGANSPKIKFFSGIVSRDVPPSDVHSTDGARIKSPLTSGKHVWEVEWPADSRGTYASIGIGIKKTPVVAKGKCSLVGNTSTSFGFDLGRSRIIRSNEVIAKYPPGNQAIPDMFYMFLDMDTGVLSFGTKTEYWGEAARNIKNIMGEEPVYVLVGITKPQGWVRLSYKGSYYYEQGPVGQAMLPMYPIEKPDYSAPYDQPIQMIAPPPFEYYQPPMQDDPPSYEQTVAPVCDQKY